VANSENVILHSLKVPFWRPVRFSRRARNACDSLVQRKDHAEFRFLFQAVFHPFVGNEVRK